MNPQVIVVRSEEDLARVSVAIKRRARVSSKPVEVVLSDLDMGERARWMRRYHKLVDLLAEGADWEGMKLSRRVWDLILKDVCLLPAEIRLPDGRVILDRPSKAEMGKAERDAFLEKVMEVAAERGVFLTNPEEE